MALNAPAPFGIQVAGDGDIPRLQAIREVLVNYITSYSHDPNDDIFQTFDSAAAAIQNRIAAAASRPRGSPQRALLHSANLPNITGTASLNLTWTNDHQLNSAEQLSAFDETEVASMVNSSPAEYYPAGFASVSEFNFTGNVDKGTMTEILTDFPDGWSQSRRQTQNRYRCSMAACFLLVIAVMVAQALSSLNKVTKPSVACADDFVQFLDFLMGLSHNVAPLGLLIAGVIRERGRGMPKGLLRLFFGMLVMFCLVVLTAIALQFRGYCFYATLFVGISDTCILIATFLFVEYVLRPWGRPENSGNHSL